MLYKSLCVAFLFAITGCGDIEDVSLQEQDPSSHNSFPSAPVIDMDRLTLITDGMIDVNTDNINNQDAFRLFLDTWVKTPINVDLYYNGENGLEIVETKPYLSGNRNIIFFSTSRIRNESSYVIFGEATNFTGGTIIVFITFQTRLKE